MINKGPDSIGVVSLVRSIQASAVRGNHEEKVLRAYSSRSSAGSFPPDNTEQEQTVDKLAERFSSDQIMWIAERPLILSLGKVPGLPYKNITVVHAGLMPGVELEKQEPFFVMNMRSIDEKKMEPREKRDEGTKWWKVWNDEQHRLPEAERMLVVYGHDSKQGLVEKEYSIGLDSGCVKGGRLSALVIGGEDKKGGTKMRIESVSCRKQR